MLQSITIEDLQHIRYRGNIPLGIAINVTFDNENSTAVIINKSDIPKESAKLSDIKRLNRIASIVRSTDHVKDKTHQGDLIKALSVRLMEDPDLVSFSASSVKMLADLYSYSQKLDENRDRIQRNVSKEKRSVMTKQYLLGQADIISRVLYLAGKHYCSSAEKKTLKQFCFENDVPYWIFVRMITKGYVNDTPHESLYKLLSSKVLGKGLQLRFEEMVKDQIWNPLSELAKNSEFVRTNLVLNKEILPKDYLVDKPKLKERMNQSVIPVIPLYTLKENLEAKRTCVPLVLKEDPIFYPQQHTIAIMQLMVGFRRKQLSPKRFWSIIGAKGQVPDLKSTIPHREQMVKLLGDKSNIDRFLEGEFKKVDKTSNEDIEKIYLAAFGTNIADSPMTKYVNFNTGKKRTVITEPKANAYRQAFAFKLKDMKPVLTDTDRKNIDSEKLRLPKSNNKKYNFPSGLMPGNEAVRLLKRVKPKDAVFHNLFNVFEKLFSSFESKTVQEKAVSLAFTEMARLKGSAFLFEGQDLSPQDEDPEESDYD